MYYADRERIQEKTLQCRERNPPGNSYRSRIWETDKWYEHEPNKSIENKRNTRYGTFDTYIDREIYVSRADKENKNCYIFFIKFPKEEKTDMTCIEKQYQTTRT